MKRQKRGKKWPGATKAPLPKSAVTLVAWDLGAMGPANRKGLEIEEAVDATPEGKAENPNGVIRTRRKDSADMARDVGFLEWEHVSYAKELLAMSEGLLLNGGDPLAAMAIRAQGSHADPLAQAFDRKRPFFTAWGRIPDDCRGAVSDVVLNGRSGHDAFGQRLCDLVDGFARLRVGLVEAFGGYE